VAEEAASFQTQRRLVLHAVGLNVGVLPSIGFGRECYVLRSRVMIYRTRTSCPCVAACVAPSCISLETTCRAEKVVLGCCGQVAKNDAVGCFLLERHAGPRRTLLNPSRENAFQATSCCRSLLLEPPLGTEKGIAEEMCEDPKL
jgi:hypothetical protein